ncbi:MAG: PpiC-type peptidyl-prolyl cis-trans isomerase [Acidobacteriaceae bacterium]|nr:PpiC-type peptidyl-prolyl cis-trans isomerase [Acidobacteriaceae bacterium]
MIRFLQNPTKTRKVFLAAILGVVIVSMVAYLGQAFTSTSTTTQGVYATIGSEQVMSAQVAQFAQQIAQRQFQGKSVPEMFLPYFQRQAAEQLVLQAALAAEARRMGLKVSDQELVDELSQGAAGKVLFPNGQFVGQEKYAEIIYENARQSVEQFEKQQKEGLLLRKLENVVEGGVTVPDAEVQREFQKQNVKVKFDYAVLTTEDLMKQVPVNDTELRAYYDKNKARFENSIPEQRKARYVIVDTSKIPVQITDDDYKRAYKQREETYRVPETVDVRHILVKTQEEADKVKKELEGGAKFEAMAKKYSQDPGSKDNGGLYAGVEHGKMVPEFDKAAFSLPVGKVSDPVKTSFGYHILRVDAKHEARLKPLNEVKGELEQALRTEKTGAQAESLANSIVTEARTGGLDKAAAKNSLNVVTTDYFNQTASLPGVGGNPQFMQAIFQQPAKGPADKIGLPTGFAIAEVVDVKPPSTPTFDQARKDVEQQFRNERASEMLAKKTEELADRARSTKDLKRAAKDLGATVKTSELVSPSGQVPDLGAMTGPGAVAFDMSQGQISGPISSGRNGVVIEVKEKQEPSATDFAKQQDQVRQGLLQQKRGEVMQLFANNLRQRMQKDGSIKINAQEQKRLLGPQSTS